MTHLRSRRPAVVVSFGQRVRELRRAAGLTQIDLGKRSRMTYKFVGEIERGTTSPTLTSIALLANGLGCEIADFFSRESSTGMMLADGDVARLNDALDVLRSVLTPRLKRVSSRAGRSEYR